MIKKLSSIRFFFTLAIVLMVVMTIGTLIPQNAGVGTYRQMFSSPTLTLWSFSGLLDVFHSVWFIGLLALLGLTTSACIVWRVSRKHFKSLPWGALTSHAAILVILTGGVVSSLFGEKGLLELKTGQSNCCVPSFTGQKTIHLPFQVAKDPGVPFVYAGFLLLPLGLGTSFYGKQNHWL